SVGLLIVPVATLYRDIQFALPTLLQFAMYLTPVVYASPIFNGAAQILRLNPVSPVLTTARECLLGMGTPVPYEHLSIIALVSVAVFIIGIIFQRMVIEILIERMGS